MRPTRIGLAAMAVTGGLMLTACGGSNDAAEPESGGADVSVVATTTMLGDVTGRVVSCVNPDAEVTTLMPPGADPHEFAASSKDATELVKADLVVATGYGLEGGLTDVLENAEADGATVLEVAPEVDPIPFQEPEGMEGHDHDHDHGDDDGHDHGDEEGHDHGDEEGPDHDHGDEEGHDHDHGDEEGHDHGDEEGPDHDHGDEEGHGHEGHNHGAEDPHFWLDVARMAKGAQVIGDHLAEKTGDDEFTACGTQVHDELMKTDDEVKAKLDAVPQEQRKLVTDHDAFGYFAEAYDFEVLGAVVPGGSTEAEPSAREVADLVATIKESGVTAIFSNTAVNTPVIDAISKEVGGQVTIVPLHVGTLGEPGSATGDYAGMMLDNAEQIAKALG